MKLNGHIVCDDCVNSPHVLGDPKEREIQFHGINLCMTHYDIRMKLAPALQRLTFGPFIGMDSLADRCKA